MPSSRSLTSFCRKMMVTKRLPSSDDYKKRYSEYMRSGAWRDKRKDRLDRDGHQCRHCGAATKLEVHHLTYERFGKEQLNDLITLCKSCHDGVHSGRIAANNIIQVPAKMTDQQPQEINIDLGRMQQPWYRERDKLDKVSGTDWLMLFALGMNCAIGGRLTAIALQLFNYPLWLLVLVSTIFLSAIVLANKARHRMPRMLGALVLMGAIGFVAAFIV